MLSSDTGARNSFHRINSLDHEEWTWNQSAGAIWDTLLRTSWGPFIAVPEALLPFPLAPECYWLFDEFLRKLALLFLSEGQSINIEIPLGNREF